MSIFKSTFKPFVVRQILTRQNLLQEVNRPIEFSHYVSSKAPWARMTSLVNYKDSDALAKKYILMGGTLYNKSGSAIPTQRSGVGGSGAAYGGDLSSTQYGITPMPGILGMTTRSLGAYGSLVEATIKFQAWDVKQLEDLSMLYMRPGYKVLLEWGWSMYLDTYKNGEDYKDKITPNALKETYNSYNIQTTKYNTIDAFSPNITQDIVYERLEELRHRYSGNYDGVLGSIKNFEYVLQPNGSYECTTVLISIGDVIDSIRMNDTLGISIGQRNVATTINPNIDTGSLDNVDYSEIKSQFELLMDDYCKVSDDDPRSGYSVITAIDNSIKDKDRDYIDPYIYKYRSGFSVSPNNTLLTPTQQIAANFNIALGTVAGKALGGRSNTTNTNTNTDTTNTATINQEQAYPVSPDNPGDKRSYYYIQFAYLLHILNVFKNVFADKQQTLVDIEIPSSPVNKNAISNGLCQASFNSISIDPNVAMIRNSQARLFKDIEGNNGFRPEIFKTETQPVKGPMVSDYNMKEYLYRDTNLGQIANIYINIKEVVSIYRQQSISNRGYVYLGEMISEIMNKVAFALGSINDFDKFVTNNKIVVIDKHYTELEADSNYANKFKINVSGNNTMVRKHKIESKIFPSQATMIAIAAQNRENIAAIQTSTYTYLNEGLTDRLFKNTDTTREGAEATGSEAVKRAKLQPILNLVEYVNSYVVVNKGMSAYYIANTTAMNGYLNTLLVELEGGTDYKAVIPISIELTVDGISGLTIGEIFTVDKKVLPKDYYDKKIGFIVTGINNEVNTNSWLTSIKTQICLLDQSDKQKITKEKADKLLGDLQKASEANRIENDISIRYYNLLAALSIDALKGSFRVTGPSGDIAIRNQSAPLFSRAAIIEYASGVITLDYLLKDFNTAYLVAYPIASLDTQRNISFRLDNLDNTNVLSQVIREMSFYKALNSEIKSRFDAEFNRVLNLINSKVPVTTKIAESRDSDVVRGTVGFEKYTIVFSKIDVNKAVDQNTGNLIFPIPFIQGYPYFK